MYFFKDIPSRTITIHKLSDIIRSAYVQNISVATRHPQAEHPSTLTEI
jgi:hypothetical protein